jgi:pSer/pThr/pTyr-binding forkhead associated (FHA) protein
LPDNKLVISDPKASSHHAEIRQAGSGYTLTDVGSTNGTFVNEQQLARSQPHPLVSGETIRIGSTRFRYEMENEQQEDATLYDDNQAVSSLPPTVAAPPVALAGTVNAADMPNIPLPPPPQEAYAPPAYLQQPAYGQPPVYGQNVSSYAGIPPAPLPAQQKKNRRILLWGVVGGVILLLLLCSGIAYATRSTPEKTLTAFCNDLQSGNNQDAYTQLSTRNRESVTEATFAQELTALSSKDGGVQSCTVANTSDDGTVGRGAITIVPNNPAVKAQLLNATLITENGTWKIDTFTVPQ